MTQLAVLTASEIALWQGDKVTCAERYTPRHGAGAADGNAGWTPRDAEFMSAPENYWSLPDRVPYGPRRRDHDCFLRGYGAASPGWGMIRCQLDQATDSAHAMSARPTPLPEFEDPPISEVALSILFSPLVNWRSAHAGLYWSPINGQYPRTETHPPLPMQIEQFDPDFMQRPMIQFEVVNPDISRFWFVADPPTKLIQVQRDRFVINWRKVKGDEIYPRYMAEMRPRFDREWKDFVAFVSQQHIGTIEVRQCEITLMWRGGWPLIAGQFFQRALLPDSAA